jgi:tRNA A37 methylthiotransferase MiaB
VRLAKGCLGKCAFCAIKFATGKLESKPLPEVMAEFQQGLDRGYDQFLFVAGDTGCYGLDIGTSIIELLSRIFSVNRDFKIILKEFNAQWLVKYYADLAPLLIQHADKIDYIIIPVQSASNAILKRMKRPYQIEDVAKCLTNLKALCPNLKITTHIMAGFPGETEADFQQSVDFIQRFEFYYVDFYGYEDRPNTESSAYDCKVSQDAIDQRLARIKAAQDSVLKRLVN